MPSSPEALNTSTLTQHQLEFLVFSQLEVRGHTSLSIPLQGQEVLAANTLAISSPSHRLSWRNCGCRLWLHFEWLSLALQ